MFAKPYHYLMGNVFNWWIGLFYGVMPSSFAFGHSRNHHQYDNSENDCVTTWDYPRDSFRNYVHYLPRWLAYHFNISTVIQFCKENEYKLAFKTLNGTVFYWIAFGAVFYHSPKFAVLYMGYPLMESALLLSGINWAWHCFLDTDEENFYAYSVTIFGGNPDTTNILNEDFHVVHHQYPAKHWTEHPMLFKKHLPAYKTNQATCLRDTHAMELFFLCILKKYDVLAEKFVDMNCDVEGDLTGGAGAFTITNEKMTYEEKKALVIRRLRTCQWGPIRNTHTGRKKA
jgi:hypothetical protein